MNKWHSCCLFDFKSFHIIFENRKEKQQQKLFMRWSVVGLSSCSCRQVLSFGGVGSDDIEADEKRSSEINGEGCLSHPSSRKQADTSLKKNSPLGHKQKQNTCPNSIEWKPCKWTTDTL